MQPLRLKPYLRQSFEIDPLDPQTVYGLAFAYMELGDMEPAQKHFQKGVGDGGTRGPARPGQELVMNDCSQE